MTPVEKLEAQALATATGGEAPARIPRIEKPRRRFGDGPLMPEYFDDAVRALDPPIVPDMAGAEDDIHVGVQAVTETLASFKIDARVTDVKRGPVITRYEVQPAPGCASFGNCQPRPRHGARAFRHCGAYRSASALAKTVIGIEVPNKRVNLVRLRDVLERHEFLAAPSKLAFVLGKGHRRSAEVGRPHQDAAHADRRRDQLRQIGLSQLHHRLDSGARHARRSEVLSSSTPSASS
jgi:S-DNA-T family DNA segregation ATPase FtsK/SpoIIIE